MLDVKDIKNLDSEDLLVTYEGNNPYIKYMKKKFQTEKKYFLTNNQSKYIKKYFTFEPKTLNKVIELTNYFAEELKEEHKLKILPKKIFVETLLAESDKAIHVISKLYKNQKDVKLIWIPKTQILDDIHYEDVELDIDFDKYVDMDKRGWRAFSHQEDGIKFLLKNKKCILADDMGLGKTYQSIESALETVQNEEMREVLDSIRMSLLSNGGRQEGFAAEHDTEYDNIINVLGDMIDNYKQDNVNFNLNGPGPKAPEGVS